MQMILPSARDFGARSATQELAYCLAGAQKLPGQIDVDNGLPLRQRHLVKWRVALQPGIGDDDVERAETRARLVEHRDDLRLVRHVGAQRDRPSPACGDPVGDGVSFALAGNVIDDDIGAGHGQRERHGLSDSRIGAGDQRLLPGQRLAGKQLAAGVGAEKFSVFPDIHGDPRDLHEQEVAPCGGTLKCRSPMNSMRAAYRAGRK
jgi:hypothetical protein